MPTDTCVIESREREHEQIATKANAEKEIDKAIKWVREEDKKMDEKYSRGPQPEQSTHYHIVRSLIKALQQAERERDAAKADMKLIVDAVRETHCDETCCFACKHDCDTSINDSGEFNNECPGFDKDDCFEWRGLPQEGEGERCQVEF